MHTHVATRPAAVAGMFYPDSPETLRRTVDSMLADAVVTRCPRPKALIVPHAGYVFSGPIAASAYARLVPHATTYARVVLIGPAHRARVNGVATSSAKTFATPIGTVEVDEAWLERAKGISRDDQAHALEHSLEVQLPFLLRVLPGVPIVPLVVGLARPEAVADVLDALWGGPETLVVVSSDLSHYLPYGDARRIDLRTAQRILRLDAPSTAARPAGPDRSTASSSRRGGRASTASCSTSGRRGTPRVHGTRSWATAPSLSTRVGRMAFRPEEGRTLASYARSVIAEALGGRRAIEPEGEIYEALGATFVTLKSGSMLRGCIGTLEAHAPLRADVARNARAAAFEDPRFHPVRELELEELSVEVSVLSARERIAFLDEPSAIAALRPGVDGVVLRHGRHRGTFLPQVWDELPEPARFLSELKRKAALPRDFWAPGIELERYTVVKFVDLPAQPPARKDAYPS